MGSHVGIAVGWQVGNCVSALVKFCFCDNQSSLEKDWSRGVNLDKSFVSVIEDESKVDDAESIECEIILKIRVALSRTGNASNELDLMKPIAISESRALSVCFLKFCLRKFGRRDLVLLSGGFR